MRTIDDLHHLNRTSIVALTLWSLTLIFGNLSNPTYAAPQAPGQVEVAQNSLAVRSGMSKTSAIVKTLRKGDRVAILLRVDSLEGAWCKVAERGQGNGLGYVLCSGLSRSVSSPEPPQAPQLGSDSTDSILPCVNASPPQKLTGGGKIYFVPFGDFPARQVEYLRDCFGRRFGLDIRALAPLKVESAAMDLSRNQLIAERLLSEITQRYPKLAAQAGVVLIGLTTEDMYSLNKPNWRFAFGWQSSRFGVVSTARFVVPYYNQMATESVVLSRLRKIVGRYLGILYYRLPPTSNSKSMVYRTLLGVDDLDALGEDF